MSLDKIDLINREFFYLVNRNPVHHYAMGLNLIVRNLNLLIYLIRPHHLKVLFSVYVHQILRHLIIEILIVVVLPIHPSKQLQLNMSTNLPIFLQRISLILHH